jgi:hypothetical protein
MKAGGADMNRPDLRRKLAKLNEELLVSLALKALTVTEKDEEFVLAIIHADEPMWVPLLDKLNPDWRDELFRGDEEGNRFVIGTFDIGMVDFLVNLSPEDETEIRRPAQEGYAKAFVLAFGGIDLFYVRYDRPDNADAN